MNPNAMAQTAPQRLMQDVAPPYTAAPTKPAPTPQPAVALAAPIAEPPQPMFPVEPAATVIAQAALAQPVAQQPTAPTKQQLPTQQAQPHSKSKVNWLVISLAIIVTVGLAVAAYSALKTSS